MRSFVTSCIALSLFGVSVAKCDLLVDATQSDGEVTFFYSGELDLVDPSWDVPDVYVGVPPISVYPKTFSGLSIVAFLPSTNLTLFPGVTFSFADTGLSFDLGNGEYSLADYASGDLLSLAWSPDNESLEVILPDNYNRESISGEMRFLGATFESMGITAAPGSYVWALPSDTITFTLNVIPEPTTLSLLGFGSLALVVVRRRR